jgi:hypothetical protein
MHLVGFNSFECRNMLRTLKMAAITAEAIIAAEAVIAAIFRVMFLLQE